MKITKLQFPPLISPFSPLNSLVHQHTQTPKPNTHRSTSKLRVQNTQMASTSAVMAVMPITSATQNKFFNPLTVKPTKAVSVGSKTAGSLQVRASIREKAVAAGISAAMTASMVIPEVAEAASGVSPSLKNFLLSIGAGTIVVVAIIGAVVGVSNFDPVKRG